MANLIKFKESQIGHKDKEIHLKVQPIQQLEYQIVL